MNILEHCEHILNYFQLSLVFRAVHYMKIYENMENLKRG